MAEAPQKKGGQKPGAMTMAMQAVSLKTSGPKVLRIGLFRDKKVVEERIIRRRETVSIGTSAKNHIIVKAGALPRKFESRFQLFQLVGDDYILNFTKEMTGKVVLPGGIQRLENLRKTGAARDAGTHDQIKLSDNSRGNIRIGDFTVFFEFVAPPPITPRPQLPAAVQGGVVKSIDWTFMAFVVFAYMLFFGFIIYMENADWVVQDDASLVPDAVARLIFEEPLEPPDVEEEQTEEAEGEETEEVERPAQKADKPDKPAGEAQEDPSTSAEARARIAEESAAQAKAMLLGAFSEEGGALSDVLAGGAVTSNAADVLAQASGVGVASQSSSGALRTRSGGGGSGQQAGLGSLKKGKAGKAAGEGKVTEREIRGNIKLNKGGDVGGSGSFDSSLVVKQIKRRLKSIQRCYEKELRQNPSLAGKVTVQFTIEQRGNVTGAKTVQNTTGSSSVGNCVTKTVARFRFNPGPDGGSVTFKYPFIFAPSN